MATFKIVKHTRVESREDRHGRIRERTLTTWDLLDDDGALVYEFARKRDALSELTRLVAIEREDAALQPLRLPHQPNTFLRRWRL